MEDDLNGKQLGTLYLYLRNLQDFKDKLLNFRPAVPVIIEDCGVIELSEPYDVSKRDSPHDVSLVLIEREILSQNFFFRYDQHCRIGEP